MEIIVEKLGEDKNDSFWYYNDVIAKVVKSDGKTLYAESHGEIRVLFEEDDTWYKNQQAVDKAVDLDLTDENLDKLNEHDGWGNNNWFTIIEVDKDGNCCGDDLGICHTYDEAIEMLKEIAKE